MAANVAQAQTAPAEKFVNGLAALQPLMHAIMLSRFMTIDLYNEPLRYEAGIALSEGRIRNGMVARPPRLALFDALFESDISDSEISDPVGAEITSNAYFISEGSPASIPSSDENEAANSEGSG